MNEIQDKAREDIFASTYGLRPRVYIYYELNDDKTYKIFRLRFNYKEKDYTLTEYYDGNSNLTDYCTLTGTDEKFDRFVDAEIKLVELMKG